jgi:hypothetical protein
MTTASDENLWRLFQPANLKRLGKLPDYLLAGLTRAPTAKVRELREQRGIPRFVHKRSAKHRWTAAQRKLLGTMTDAAAAGAVGTTEFQTEAERKRLGIAPYVKPMAVHAWLPSQDALLGVESDALLAVRLGVSIRVVRLRRRELGIPRQRGSGTVKGGYVPRTAEQIWTPEVLSQLGKITDSILAAHLKLHTREVRAKRESLGIPRSTLKHPGARDWTAEEIAMLGTMSDTDMAKKLKMNRSCVAVRRIAEGIPRFDRTPEPRVWTNGEDALFDKHTDLEVAALLMINPSKVRLRRKQLGIPRKTGSFKRKILGKAARRDTLPTHEDDPVDDSAKTHSVDRLSLGRPRTGL